MHPVQLQIIGIRAGDRTDGAQPLTIDTNRGPLEVALHEATRATRLVMCVGGVGGGLEGPAMIYPRLGAELPAHGLAVMRLAYRRPGILEECLGDVRAGLSLMVSRGIGEIALVGHSFGGEVVILIAAHDPRIAAVVAISSHLRGAIDSVAALAPRPLLLIHGEADKVVNVQDSVKLYAQAGEPKALKLFPGADHVLSQVSEEAYVAVRDWLLEHFAPAVNR